MKAKTFIAGGILFLACFQAKAGDTNMYKDGSFIAINAGICIPFGSYATGVSTRGTLFNSNGYALTGEVYNISAGILLHRNVGIATDMGYNTNGFDVSQLVSNTPGTSTGSGTSGQWQIVNMTAGIFLTFPAKKVSFDTRFLLGANYINTPSVSYSVTKTNGTVQAITVQMNKKSGFAFVSGLGAGARLHLSGHFCLRADVAFYASPFKFNSDYTETDNTGKVVSTGTNSCSMDVLLFNITLGVSYSF